MTGFDTALGSTVTGQKSGRILGECRVDSAQTNVLVQYLLFELAPERPAT